MPSEEKKFVIQAPNIKRMTVSIKGTAPLIFHKWSEKVKKQMLEKQMKKANRGREVRDPQREYEESFYYDKEKRIAFPALCIKLAMVSAARNVEGLAMTLLRGAVFVMGDSEGLIPVEYKEKSMREDMVRTGGISRGADLRFRGQVTDWRMTFLIKFNADVLSGEQVINLLQIAGFAGGLGEWRPEKDGDFGTFEVEMGSKSALEKLEK